MQKIMCEMCGSTDILKEDCIFICQNCGIKYSVEEIKKMLTVKIDNNENIENYLELAKHEYKSGNIGKCKNYCDKILELDSKNYEAWLLKGKTESEREIIENGFQSFKNSLENIPKEENETIKEEIKITVLNLNSKIMHIYCEQSKKAVQKNCLDMEIAHYIINAANGLKSISMELLLKCGVEEDVFNSELMAIIYNFAVNEFAKTRDEYYELEKPIKNQWDFLVKEGDAAIFLVETAIKSSNQEDCDYEIMYKNLTFIQQVLLNYEYFDYYEKQDNVWKGFSQDERKLRKNKLKEWHTKWHEINFAHAIPLDSQLENWCSDME